MMPGQAEKTVPWFVSELSEILESSEPEDSKKKIPKAEPQTAT